MLLYNVACCDVQNFASFPSLPLLVQHSSSTYNFRLVLVCDCDFFLALPPGGVHVVCLWALLLWQLSICGRQHYKLCSFTRRMRRAAAAASLAIAVTSITKLYATAKTTHVCISGNKLTKERIQINKITTQLRTTSILCNKVGVAFLRLLFPLRRRSSAASGRKLAWVAIII